MNHHYEFATSVKSRGPCKALPRHRRPEASLTHLKRRAAEGRLYVSPLQVSRMAASCAGNWHKASYALSSLAGEDDSLRILSSGLRNDLGEGSGRLYVCTY